MRSGRRAWPPAASASECNYDGSSRGNPDHQLKDIRKSFGPVEVLKGVDMDVSAGKVHRARR